MAEIDIQPKKRPVWPWILGIIAAIVIIWIIIRALNNNNNNNNNNMNNDNMNGNTGQLDHHRPANAQIIIVRS